MRGGKTEIMKKSGGRIVWLDTLKGICMLCTMIGHYTFFPKDIAACYAPFFLSAFLFAAGYTFHLESSFKRFVEKKIRTVLFPWLWMGLLSLLSRQIISFNSHAGVTKDLQNFFLQIRGKGDEGWFFICLFGSEIVFYLMVSHVKNKKELLVVSMMGSLLSFGYSLITNDFRLPWHIQMYGSACFFLSLGYVVNQCEKEKKADFLDEKYLPLSVVLYTILFVVDCKIIGGESITFYTYGESIWMYYLLSLISVWMIVLVARSIRPPGWLVFVGENTLLYYGLHGKVGSAFTAIVTKIIGADMSRTTSVVLGIVGLAAIVLVLMPIIWVINTKMNFLLGKKVNKN